MKKYAIIRVDSSGKSDLHVFLGQFDTRADVFEKIMEDVNGLRCDHGDSVLLSQAASAMLMMWFDRGVPVDPNGLCLDTSGADWSYMVAHKDQKPVRRFEISIMCEDTVLASDVYSTTETSPSAIARWLDDCKEVLFEDHIDPFDFEYKVEEMK